MYNISISKEDLAKIISKEVNELMESNREDFNKNKQIMTPMSSQISVLATLRVLQELGLIKFNETSKE